LLFPSAGVWLAILRVALVREPQQVSTKAARRPCCSTYCRRAARSSVPGSSRRGCTVSPLGQAPGWGRRLTGWFGHRHLTRDLKHVVSGIKGM